MTDTTGRAADLAAIHALVTALGTAFNAKDAAGAVEPFVDDAWTVTVAGARLCGRTAMLAALREAFAGPQRDMFARYDVLDVAFPAADTALAAVRVTATDRAGAPIDVGHAMLALHVLVRRGDGWRVAARQDTLVPG